MEVEDVQSRGSNHLVLKDCINIAIFSVIYSVGMVVFGMPFGFLVITSLAYPFAVGLAMGIPMMLFLAKTPKPFALFIFVALQGAIMTLMGHSYVLAIHSFGVAVLAELVRKFLGYKTIKGSIAGYAVMCAHCAGEFLPIYIVSEQYRAVTETMMGKEYADQLMSLPIWIMPILYVTAIIGGVLGGFLGVKILKKHFAKAGLV